MTLPENSHPEKKEHPFPTSEDNPTQNEEALDEALKESFPASDPVSISTEKTTPADSADKDALRSKTVPEEPKDPKS
jgi:hypothetical protein